MRVLCVKIQDPQSLEKFAECAYRCTPQVALRARECVFLEISQCAHLWSESTVLGRLDVIARRLGVSFKLGVGETPGEALAQVNRRFFESSGASHTASDSDSRSASRSVSHGTHLSQVLSLSALHDFFDPFQLLSAHSEAQKKIAKAISVLEGLGVKTFDEVFRIPQSQISSRFGRDVDWALSSVKRERATLWPRFVPVDVIEESYDVGALCEGESFLFVLKTLLDRIFLRLSARGERLESVDIEIYQPGVRSPVGKGVLKKRKIPMHFYAPQGSAKLALDIFRDIITREFEQNPLRDEVSEVRARVVKTSPGRILQSDFFSKSEENAEGMNALLSRLSSSLGEKKAFFAKGMSSHRPENAWSGCELKSVEKEGVYSEKKGERPNRLLKQPLRTVLISDLRGSVATQDPQSLFRDSWLVCKDLKKRWRVSALEGPERLEGEWWSEDPLTRDYFKLQTESGERLWIFRSENGYYLHGFFD